MLEHATADRTLPSVVANSSATARRQALVLTILFHPDTDRIGETAVFYQGSGPAVLAVGQEGAEVLAFDHRYRRSRTGRSLHQQGRVTD